MLMRTSPRQLEHLRHLGAQLLDVLALLADHDARPGRVDRDVRLAGRALDLDAADGGLRQLLAQELADPSPGRRYSGKFFVSAYQRESTPGDAEADADWMYFLTHG
jgi:hypothetical protein